MAGTAWMWSQWPWVSSTRRTSSAGTARAASRARWRRRSAPTRRSPGSGGRTRCCRTARPRACGPRAGRPRSAASWRQSGIGAGGCHCPARCRAPGRSAAASGRDDVEAEGRARRGSGRGRTSRSDAVGGVGRRRRGASRRQAQRAAAGEVGGPVEAALSTGTTCDAIPVEADGVLERRRAGRARRSAGRSATSASVSASADAHQTGSAVHRVERDRPCRDGQVDGRRASSVADGVAASARSSLSPAARRASRSSRAPGPHRDRRSGRRPVVPAGRERARPRAIEVVERRRLSRRRAGRAGRPAGRPTVTTIRSPASARRSRGGVRPEIRCRRCVRGRRPSTARVCTHVYT